MYFRACIGLLITLLLSGCNRAPVISAPEYNPERSAAMALELFDKSSDGVLDETELQASPGLQVTLKDSDGNQDGKLSEDEIVVFLSRFSGSTSGALNVHCIITRGSSKGVADAEVLFEPEPFLEGTIVPARGKTDMAGEADLTCSATPLGIQPGLYRVRITDSDGSIPARYNSETELGVEVSGTSPGYEAGYYHFQLNY